MTSIRNEYMYLSTYTAKFLEDTGWYLPNYDFSQEPRWFKSRDCQSYDVDIIRNSEDFKDIFCDNEG